MNSRSIDLIQESIKAYIKIYILYIYSALSDRKCASKLKNLRHTAIAKSIAKWALRAGAESAETEPKKLWTTDQKRPDIDLILGAERILVDVAVVQPSAPSYVVSAQHPLGGSAEMVRVKESKYEVLAATLDATVAPAVIETFGALTSPCVDLFNRIADYAKENPQSCWSSYEVYRGLVLETSIQLQLWNTKTVKEGKRRVRICEAVRRNGLRWRDRNGFYDDSQSDSSSGQEAMRQASTLADQM